MTSDASATAAGLVLVGAILLPVAIVLGMWAAECLRHRARMRLLARQARVHRELVDAQRRRRRGA